MNEKIKEAGRNYSYEKDDKNYGKVYESFIAGATSPAAKEYWSGVLMKERDELIKSLKVENEIQARLIKVHEKSISFYKNIQQ